MTKQIHNEKQGSTEWLSLRMTKRPASLISAVMGLSPYNSRTDILKTYATGLPSEVNSFVERFIFAEGHRVEPIAREMIENIIGEDLSPMVYSKGLLSASTDGINFAETIGFECKQWNEKLAELVREGIVPDSHMPQVQQCLLVTDADEWYFTVSDGTEEKTVYTIVKPDQEWFDRIVSAWEQFDKDLENYQIVEHIEKPKADPIKDLPMVNVQVRGELTLCNLDDVRPLFDDFLSKALVDLKTDDDFAQAEAEAKMGRETAKRCKLTAKAVVDQMLSVSEVTRTLEEYASKFDAMALKQEKLVKSQKELIKTEIMGKASIAWVNHKNELNGDVKPVNLVLDDPNFSGAMKNKRTLASLHDAVDTELANAKIKADAIAREIRLKLTWFNDYVTITKFLFTDLQAIITGNGMEAFQSIVKSRISEYTIEQEKKADIERKRIQEEEQRKAEAAQAKKLEAERAAIREEERIKAESEAKAIRDEEIRIANLVRKEQSEIKDEQELESKQKTEQKILEEEPVTLAIVVTTESVQNTTTPEELRASADRIYQAAQYADRSSDRNREMALANKLYKEAENLEREMQSISDKPEIEPTIIKEIEPTITITVSEHKRLLDRIYWLECLQSAGVDNWDGYDYAIELYENGLQDKAS